MNSRRLPIRLSRLVWQRADSYCEYCQLHQVFDLLPHHVDHVVARKHEGPDTEDNLALACVNCSLAKGSNIAGLDSRTGQVTPLFHPRTQRWGDHFRWHGPQIVGRTSIVRATVAVLNMNRPDRVALREMIIAEGTFPPAWD